MKVTSLSLLAGLAGAVAAAPVHAGGFTSFETVPNEFGLTVLRVYAQLPGAEDRLLGVGGTALTPMTIEAVGAPFFQHTLGNDLPPHIALLDVIPSLEFDTFVTIGLASHSGTDQTFMTPGWPGFGTHEVSTDAGGWFVPPVAEQASPDEQGRVLLAQLALDDIAGYVIFDANLLMEIDGRRLLVEVRRCFNTLSPCIPEDLNFDGVIDTTDFLALLAEWGMVRSPADVNQDDIVDTLDFLQLLGAWTSRQEIGPEPSGDINGDGVVDVQDLLQVISCAGPAVGDCVLADLDGDGTVGVFDLIIVLSTWGPA